MIHNHGTEEGAGLLCREVRLSDGSLRGVCTSRYVRIHPYIAPYWGVNSAERFFVEGLSRSGASVYLIIKGVRTSVPIGAVIEERYVSEVEKVKTVSLSEQLDELDLSITKSLGRSYQAKALRLVRTYIEGKLEKTDEVPGFDVYVVWFCKILQNWKALVSTTLPDGMYYEVTYDGDKRATYIDAYKKFDNVAIAD